MFRVYRNIIMTGLLTLLLLFSAMPRAWAWDTTVYAKNCYPQVDKEEWFIAFNGNDGLLSAASDNAYLTFLETGSFDCNQNGTGSCKVCFSYSDSSSCESVSNGNLLLVYDISGNKVTQQATSTSPTANCCAMTAGVGDTDCETYFWECRHNDISGIKCAITYVPCRAGGSDEATCVGNM